jgi:YidC/Oxa1 family membrane protein insertase
MLWHQLFTFIGLDPKGGATWILALIGLVVVVRSAIIPVTVRQIKSQRRMMDLQPELKKLQAKYKGKRDQFSREAMTRETSALYKKHGTNPFASCLPMLVQMPVFFSLFSVLRNAADGKNGVGFMSKELTRSFNEAVLFGAPLKMTFTEGWKSGNTAVTILLGTIMVLMIASQFYTQLQIVSKNVSDETKNSQAYKTQRIMLYIIPFAFLFSGFAFPLALNIYWFTSNLWTMGQQFVVINNMPNPGSEAWRKREAKLAAKNSGKLDDDGFDASGLSASGEPKPPPKPTSTQREQPMSAKRAKKKK